MKVEEKKIARLEILVYVHQHGHVQALNTTSDLMAEASCVPATDLWEQMPE